MFPFRPVARPALVAPLLLPVTLFAQPTPDSPPVAVASAYLEAMETSDLDAAEALFTEPSSVYESGGVEGTWSEYRADHLGPEIDAIDTFVIHRGEPESVSSVDGTLAFVAWPLEYTIALADGRTIESRGTVTFVLIREEGEYRIRHLHWSSRRKQAGAG